jgi:hypothetical protein
LVLVEVATYPEKRAVEQIQADIRLVREARGVLPEAVVLCLAQRGRYRVPEQAEESSPLGWTAETLRWKVVELWTRQAEDLLAAPDVGLVPLAPLAQYDGPPEVLLQRCRDRVEREGGAERANLLAVTQVFASLLFNRPELLDILGGRRAMDEFPLIKKIRAESGQEMRRKDILVLLEDRFGTVTPAVTAGLARVQEEEKLLRLLRQTGKCPSLEAFEVSLREELPAPPAPSTRTRRRSRKPPTEEETS